MTINERIFVVDYGGQYTHLISRRCRELGVYSEIIPQDAKLDENMLQGVRGLILTTKSLTDFDRNFKVEVFVGIITGNVEFPANPYRDISPLVRVK